MTSIALLWFIFKTKLIYVVSFQTSQRFSITKENINSAALRKTLQTGTKNRYFLGAFKVEIYIFSSYLVIRYTFSKDNSLSTKPCRQFTWPNLPVTFRLRPFLIIHSLWNVQLNFDTCVSSVVESLLAWFCRVEKFPWLSLNSFVSFSFRFIVGDTIINDD